VFVSADAYRLGTIVVRADIGDTHTPSVTSGRFGRLHCAANNTGAEQADT
jgi:hypothetical protein